MISPNLYTLLSEHVHLFCKIEPGSQTEQAPPSAIFWLGPQDMHGFRFLTISVAPRPVPFLKDHNLFFCLHLCFKHVN